MLCPHVHIKMNNSSSSTGFYVPKETVALRSKGPLQVTSCFFCVTMAEPTDGELREVIRRVVAKVDLENTGIKKFTKLLSRELGGIDLKPRSKFIKQTLTEVINEGGDESEEEEDEEEEEEEEEETVVETKPKKKRKAVRKTGGGGGGGGLSAMKEISNELADLLGKGKQMARTEVVKEMWNYIREHNLQNPENKREIILDERMKRVFGCDTFSEYVGECGFAVYSQLTLLDSNVYHEQVCRSAHSSFQTSRFDNFFHTEETKK